MNRFTPVEVLALFFLMGIASARTFYVHVNGQDIVKIDDYYRYDHMEMKEHQKTGKTQPPLGIIYGDDCATDVNPITIEDIRRELIKIYRKYLTRNGRSSLCVCSLGSEEVPSTFGEAFIGIFLEIYALMLNFICFA